MKRQIACAVLLLFIGYVVGVYSVRFNFRKILNEPYSFQKTLSKEWNQVTCNFKSINEETREVVLKNCSEQERWYIPGAAKLNSYVDNKQIELGEGVTCKTVNTRLFCAKSYLEVALMIDRDTDVR